MLSIVITDPTKYEGSGGEDFVITIFKAKQEDLPEVDRGMAMMFRNVLVRSPTFHQSCCPAAREG